MRGAWLTLPLLLLKQYVMAAFLGLAVPSGGCGYEQASPVCLAHHILVRTTCRRLLFLQVGVVACLCTRWLLPVLMRPHGDVVGFVYECMSVTGEALSGRDHDTSESELLQCGSNPRFCDAELHGALVLGNLGAQVRVGRVAYTARDVNSGPWC
jgi:hypothetical protein